MENNIKVLDGEIFRIDLDGSLDSELSAKLENIILNLDGSDGKKILIDLKKVPEVTPAGVRVLLMASFNPDLEGLLQLQNPNNNITQLMKTVGLDSLIN